MPCCSSAAEPAFSWSLLGLKNECILSFTISLKSDNIFEEQNSCTGGCGGGQCWIDQFPTAALIKNHKPSGLKQQKYIYFLTVPEARRLKPRRQQTQSFLVSPQVLLAASSPRRSWACSCITLVSASMVTWLSSLLSLCFSVSFPLLVGTTIILDYRPP